MSETNTPQVQTTPEQQARKVQDDWAASGCCTDLPCRAMTKLIAAALQQAVADATFATYDKARDLVGHSPSAQNAIEAQMQRQFPDRAFVTSQQARAGSRMDGANLRMPKSPAQIAQEAVAAEREAVLAIHDAELERLEQMQLHGYAADLSVMGRVIIVQSLIDKIRARSTDAPETPLETIQREASEAVTLDVSRCEEPTS